MTPAADIPACNGQSECFAFTIDTRLTDTLDTDPTHLSGADTDFIIPTSSQLNYANHSYNWIIDWGDGVTQPISDISGYASGQAGYSGISHTYPAPERYQITIRPNGSATNGWFNAFGFAADGTTGANQSTNKLKVYSLDTPLSNLMRTQNSVRRFASLFFGVRNALGIPTNLLANISTASTADLSFLFTSTFRNFAANSTTAIIPSGLFDSLNTAGGSNFEYAFQSTFFEAATNSAAATIPDGLFSKVDTTNATNAAAMFQSTFANFAIESTVGTIPANLFSTITTNKVTNFNNLFANTFSGYAANSTIGTIPAGLFSTIIVPSNAVNLSSMFSAAFANFAQKSPNATIPAGLFGSITLPNTSSLDILSMFSSTFNNYAANSLVATIPSGLFSTIVVQPNTRAISYMFANTFRYYAANSLVATVPTDLFSGFNSRNATSRTGVFSETFVGYGRRQAQFIVAGSVVDTQTFYPYLYSVKVGFTGAPAQNPTIPTGATVYPTYANVITYTITAPSGAYASTAWYTKDGTSCAVADPTPDCGVQNYTAIANLPDSSRWLPSASTEVAGNMTYYAVAANPPTVISVSPNRGLADVTDQVIIITGTDFTGATSVTVGNEPCTAYTVNNDTTISCTLPTFNTASAGVKDVLVTTSNGTSTTNANAKYEVIAQYIEVTANGTVPITVTPNHFSSGQSIATVSTNAPTGYQLKLQATAADLNKVIAPPGTIPALSGYTATSPSSASNTSALIGNTSFWAYRVTNQSSFGTTTTQETNQTSTAYSWATVPTTDTVIRTGTTTDNLTTNTPQNTDVWFGTSPTLDKPAGAYATTITYTVSVDL
jgi:hypothetical protein